MRKIAAVAVVFFVAMAVAGAATVQITPGQMPAGATTINFNNLSAGTVVGSNYSPVTFSSNWWGNTQDASFINSSGGVIASNYDTATSGCFAQASNVCHA